MQDLTDSWWRVCVITKEKEAATVWIFQNLSSASLWMPFFDLLDKMWVCHVLQMFVSKMLMLTPSLPQLVNFPGWKMHGRACKQYIFWSYDTSTLSLMLRVLMKILSHANARKKRKKA